MNKARSGFNSRRRLNGAGHVQRLWMLAALVPTLLSPLALRAQEASQPPATTTAPAAATAVLPPAEDFFARPAMSQPRLSRSGRYLAMLVRGQGERNALAVLDLQAMDQSKALVRFSDVDINTVQWVGDEHLVFTVIDLQAGSGDRYLAPGLFVVDREGGAMRELVRLRPTPIVRDGSRGPDRRLDYNHKLLHVPDDGSGEIIVGEIRFGGDGAVDRVTPLRLNVKSQRTRSVLQRTPPGALGWTFDPRGEPRVAYSADGPRARIHWRAPGQDDWQLLSEGSRLALPWTPYGVNGQGELYVRAPTGAGGTAVLTRYDFAARAPERSPMVSTPGFDFSGALLVDRDSGATLGVRAMVDAEETVWLNPELKAVQADIDRRLPGRVNRISCAPCTGEQRNLLIESYADRDPGAILVWRSGKPRPELVGQGLKVDVNLMATVEMQRIKARDGRDLPVWLTVPHALPAGQPAPAVVLLHGGPWARGQSWGWRPMQQFLASRGYVVIEPEFRGSTGYGAAHFRAGWRQWGQAMQDDVADAVLWATREKRIDPNRVCIAGASYGGYATLMGLVRHPELYRCGIAWLAVADLMRLVEGGFWIRDDVSDDARQYSIPTMVGDAKADREMLLANSPLEQAARIKKPLLLVHGAEDRRVPLVHAKDLREAMTKAGNAPEWHVYDDEGHGWRRQVNQVDFAKRFEAFLGKHLNAK